MTSFLVVIYSGAGLSQTNFLDGYVLLNEYDTLYGRINNNNSMKNALLCELIPSNSDSVRKYIPSQIYGYRFIDGKYYVSKHVGNRMIFLEYLVNGNLDIFYYLDSFNADHYFASNDSVELVELTYMEYTKKVDGKTYLYKSSPYVGVLSRLTNDCPELKPEIPEIRKPDRKKLISLARRYHQLTCDANEQCIIYEKEIPRGLILDISGGYSYQVSYEHEDNKQHNYPVFGMNFLFQETRKSESFYIGMGIHSARHLDDQRLILRLPLSFNYLNSRMGLSPVFSYQLDLNNYLMTQGLRAGCKYQLPKFAFYIAGEMLTYLIIVPYNYSVNMGMMWNLN